MTPSLRAGAVGGGGAGVGKVARTFSTVQLWSTQNLQITKKKKTVAGTPHRGSVSVKLGEVSSRNKHFSTFPWLPTTHLCGTHPTRLIFGGFALSELSMLQDLGSWYSPPPRPSC